MRATGLILVALLALIPVLARGAEQAPASSDSRYPVNVTSEQANRQKTEMRSNLVALRDTLARLADKDFPGVERSLRGLVHTGPVSERPGVSTKVFRDLETQFEASVDKTVEAARSQNVDVVLRALSETMAYCQSCHAAFRESLEPKPATEPAKKP